MAIKQSGPRIKQKVEAEVYKQGLPKACIIRGGRWSCWWSIETIYHYRYDDEFFL